MFLKKASVISMLALAVSISSVSVSSAATATVKQSTAVQISSSTFIVNGETSSIHSLIENGKTLVSVRELSTKLGVKLKIGTNSNLQAMMNGHTIDFKTNSNMIMVDGVQQLLSVPVKGVKGVNYIELEAFVLALGGHIAKDNSGTVWISADLLGNVDDIKWANSSQIIASQETETGRIDYIVEANSGKYVKLLDASDASELVINPNGTKAAYTNAAGEVFVLNLNTKTSVKVSTDTSIKPELVWSADGKALYILQGDKGSVIVKLELTTGAITKVLEDKVDYKANLSVSQDGKIFTYTVTKPGAVVADASKPVESDDVAIDMKGTEPQIYQFDSSVKEGKPVKLTTGTDDKVFIQASSDASNVYYVSVDADAAANSALSSVDKDKVVKTLFKDKDVYQATMSGGKWYLLTAGEGSSQFIYEVESVTGTVKQLYTVSDSVSQVIVRDSSIAIMDNGLLYVNMNGQWKPTTL